MATNFLVIYYVFSVASQEQIFMIVNWETQQYACVNTQQDDINWPTESLLPHKLQCMETTWMTRLGNKKLIEDLKS